MSRFTTPRYFSEGRRLRQVVGFLGLGLILMPAIRAQESVVLPLMKHAAREVLADGAPGVSLAVVVHGQTYFWSEGSSGRPNLAVNQRTIFETASISKVFTTTLLGIDVARGQKSLQDRIGKYLRRPLQMRMRQATLEMLATFNAGLPGEPPAFHDLTLDKQSVSSYPVGDFLRFISEWEPARRLPAPRFYSDASVGLLGLCLGHLSLNVWDTRLRREIYRPLGMKDTGLYLDPERTRRLAQGIQSDGTLAERWPVDVMAAADGVKSTTFDLAQFLSGLLGNDPALPTDLSLGMAIATQTGYPIFHGDGFQALAWTWAPTVVGGTSSWVITKNGNIPGFSSQISFDRDLGIGAALLSNRGNLPVRDIELKLINQLAQALN